jgi:hypothetical protein
MMNHLNILLYISFHLAATVAVINFRFLKLFVVSCMIFHVLCATSQQMRSFLESYLW